MSDYVRIKAVRYKPTEANLKEINNDLLSLEDKFPKFFNYKRETGRFSIEGTDKCTYVDFLVEYEYGTSEGEHYQARTCTPGEAAIFSKLIDRLFPESGCHMANLRVVEYAWYNGVEPEDCFEVEDDFSKSVEFFGLQFEREVL